MAEASPSSSDDEENDEDSDEPCTRGVGGGTKARQAKGVGSGLGGVRRNGGYVPPDRSHLYADGCCSVVGSLCALLPVLCLQGRGYDA